MRIHGINSYTEVTELVIKTSSSVIVSVGCSKEDFPYLGVKSVLALSQLDLTEGDNAKIDERQVSDLSCLD
jgi:hypothetical protein